MFGVNAHLEITHTEWLDETWAKNLYVFLCNKKT